MASGAAGPHEVQRLPGPVIGGRMPARSGLGPLLRDWRQRRRLSQLGLATEAGISPRHLSFVETGRARASRALLLQLAELLELPLRERNRLLLAGGYAPQFVEHAWADPTLASAHAAVQRILTAHEPYPALAVDRHWNLLMSNRVADALLAGIAPELRTAPLNVLRVSLDPRGLAPMIANLGAWRTYLLTRLRRLAVTSEDPLLWALHAELASMPALPDEGPPEVDAGPVNDVLMPLRLRTALGELALFGTLTVFGTPTEITLSEVAIEAFFPADAETAERLRALAG